MKGKHRYKCYDCESEFLSGLSPEAAGFYCMPLVIPSPPPRDLKSWRKRVRPRNKGGVGVWSKRPEPEGRLGRILYDLNPYKKTSRSNIHQL